jgi:hypothetical protein
MGNRMKNASNRMLAVSLSAGALIAAVGLGAQSGDYTAEVEAAPAYSSPEPPPPPPPPPTQQVPSDDYWTGQAGGGGAPGAGGGG